jgi:hypothetical protein
MTGIFKKRRHGENTMGSEARMEVLPLQAKECPRLTVKALER